MPVYEIGITEINTQVRRLGYASAILSILGNRTLNESLLYNRLEQWSVEHREELENYCNQQGQIKPTQRTTGAKRYTDFVVSLGLVGRIAGACRVTRFGKTILPFLNRRPASNGFDLSLTERLSYLYWLLVKDSDRLLTVVSMLAEKPSQSLRFLQENFQSHYLRYLTARLSVESGRVAQEILHVRNRVAHEWKNPPRYAESIVPPRIHWLLDLGLVQIAGTRGKPARLTEKGRQFLDILPKIRDFDVPWTNPSWANKQLFSSVGPILTPCSGWQWAELSDEERMRHLAALLPLVFKILRSSPARKVSLYPAILYISLLLAIDEQIWANLEDLRKDIDIYSKSGHIRYAVRFSHRENESYLTYLPN